MISLQIPPASKTLHIPPQTPPLTHPIQPTHSYFPCYPCSSVISPQLNAPRFHLFPLSSLAASTLGMRSPEISTLSPGSLTATLAPLHRLRSHLCSATSCSANLLLIQCGNVLDMSRQIRLPSTGSTREPGATGTL